MVIGLIVDASSGMIHHGFACLRVECMVGAGVSLHICDLECGQQPMGTHYHGPFLKGAQEICERFSTESAESYCVWFLWVHPPSSFEGADRYFSIVMCIFHCLISVGKKTTICVRRYAKKVAPAVRAEVQRILTEANTKILLEGKASTKGEETWRLLIVWPPIAHSLHVPLSCKKGRDCDGQAVRSSVLYIS